MAAVLEDGTCDVHYQDGDIERRLARDRIKVPNHFPLPNITDVRTLAHSSCHPFPNSPPILCPTSFHHTTSH